MKRILSLALTILMLLSLAACGAPEANAPASEPAATQTPASAPAETAAPEPTAPPTYEDAELARAVELGIGAYREDDPNVTYVEFFAMLDKAVELIDSARLAEWRGKFPEARADTSEINRGNAMCAVFSLAEFLGGEYWQHNRHESIQWDAPAPWDTNEWSISETYWGDLMRFPAGFGGVTEPDGSNFGGTAYSYSMGCTSRRSGESIFDFDVAQSSMRCADLLTYEEALCAVLRFYEVTESSSQRIPTELDAEISAAADERRQAILDTPTEVMVSGTSYYVSVSGSDDNDGLTPETPWQTLQKASDAKLKSGDGVFFKRGDIWRGEYLVAQSGVTYSAYGEGAKPAFYGSPENGADADKWTLLEGSDNIWVYHIDLPECGTLVFNDKTAGIKIMPYLQNGAYTMPDDSGAPFDVAGVLTENLSFYSDDKHFLMYEEAYSHNKADCKLYLRCDEGNPGEVFASIEFCTWINIASSDKGLICAAPDSVHTAITIDNIEVKYTGVYGININSASLLSVQNCVVGWIGGCVTNYYTYDETVRFGNCVGSFGTIDGYSVKNCWLYQAYDAGISDEGKATDHGSPTADHHSGVLHTGNLIEACTYGIEMFIECDIPDQNAYMKNVVLSDNMIINSGYGWGYQRKNKDWAAAIQVHSYQHEIIDMRFENNVLYRSRTALIICWAGTDTPPQLSGNTYVQDNFAALAYWQVVEDGVQYDNQYTFDDSAPDVVRDIMGDANVVVAPLSYPS